MARPGSVIPIASSVALAALVVLLGVQTRTLKRELARRPAASSPGLPDHAKPGPSARAPSLFIVDEAGEARIVPAPGEPVVLFISASGCHACPEAREPWQALGDHAQSLGVQAYAIHVRSDAIAGGAAQHESPGVGAPCRFVGPMESLVALAPGFPACVVINASGRMVRAAVGVPGPDDLSELIAAIEEASR